MKKLLPAAIIMIFCFTAVWSQNLSITFSTAGLGSPIDQVKATNLQTGQSITLPGTETLILTDLSGIPSISQPDISGVAYPNPFPGKAIFSANFGNAQTIDLKLQNLVGQVVAETKAMVQPGENDFTFTVNTAGIYLISLITEQGNSSYKIICTESEESENSILFMGAGADKQNLRNFSSHPGCKTSQKTYLLGYKPGDVILYKCKKGIYTTILADKPVSPKEYKLDFVDCTDPDGRTYSVVEVGNQTWMAENLAYLPAVSPSNEGSETSYYFYVSGYEGTSNNDAKATATYAIYGVLYNWAAARNACPEGWKLPSDDDWTALTNFIGTAAGGKMKETGFSHWLNQNTGATNESGFTALPGGIRQGTEFYGGFGGLSQSAGFSSSTDLGKPYGIWFRLLSSIDDEARRNYIDYMTGLSVRCVKNNSNLVFPPNVTTNGISDATTNEATCGGYVWTTGGANVTARGVCWSSVHDPTIADSKTVDGAGIGSYISTMTGLTENTYYHVRAYATNSAGTSYGDPVYITTLSSSVCQGTIQDPRDGQRYCYKVFGTQTWMTENMAFLPSVSVPVEGSETSPYYYVQGYEYDFLGFHVSRARTSVNYLTYGALYNWEAAKTACPAGWHLPSDADWTTLTDYIGGSAGGKMKESGYNHWQSPNTGATNSSGFNALPGGSRNLPGGFNCLGTEAFFSSSTEIGSPYGIWFRLLRSTTDQVDKNYIDPAAGISVRCVKDN